MMKTAIVIGATGLVGTALLDQLLADARFERVKVLGRRPTGRQHGKLEEHTIDFERPVQWQHLVRGDVLFSALGTTLQAAGSKAAQYKIDYTYQFTVAEAAARNGVGSYVLVSSAGASPSSYIFYSRMKGELERDVQQLAFSHIHIIRPGLLAGERKEARTGEKIGHVLMGWLKHVPLLKQYQPIDAAIVARAMVNAAFDTAATRQAHTLRGVFALAGHPL